MTHPVPTHRSFIHGRSFANGSGKTFPVLNPGTGQIIYEVEIADEIDATAGVGPYVVVAKVVVR